MPTPLTKKVFEGATQEMMPYLEEIDRLNKLVDKMRDAFRQLYADNGEDPVIAGICTEMLEATE